MTADATPGVASDGTAGDLDGDSVPPLDAGRDARNDAEADRGLTETLTLDPALTESIGARSSLGQRVTVIVPRRAIRPDEVAVLVNEDDPQSVTVAAHYLNARGIPPSNRIAVRIPAGAEHIDRQVFAKAKADVDAALAERDDIQALAITWTQPWRVEGMSITSAFALGFSEAYFHPGSAACSQTQQHDYFLSPSVRPYDDHKIRPAMMLAGRSPALVRAMINRAVSAEGTFPRAHGYFLRTNDSARSNPRTPDFRQAMEAWQRDGGLTLTLRDNAAGPDEQNALRHTDDVLFYFTGLNQVPDLHTNAYVPGAVADHLTGFGGQLTGGPEMSVLRWLEAGVSASYGTVSEPCAWAAKFPATRHLLRAYLSGATVLEAYWKSVEQAGQGLFVGDPLTRPFGTRVRLSDDGELEIFTSVLDPGKTYALYAAHSVQGPFQLVQDSLAIGDQPTFTQIRQHAGRQVYALVARASSLRIRRLTQTGTALDPSISGEHVVWESTPSEGQPGEVFLWEVATQAARPITRTPSGLVGKAIRRRQPEIFGNTVVWRSPTNPLALLLYDVQTRKTRHIPLEGASNDAGLHLHGKRLVWADDRDGNADVFLYDLETGQQRQLTSDSANQSNPALAAKRVVWQDDRYGRPSIQLLDLESGQQQRLSTPPAGARDVTPAISDGVVVWRREDIAVNGFAHIYEHLLPGGEQRRLSATGDFQAFALPRALSGSRIVWPDGRHGAEAIYLYDRDSGEQRRISAQWGLARRPAISGHRIVWELWRPTGTDIYLLDEPAGDEGPPTMALVADRVVSAAGEPLAAHVRATDPEGLPLQYGARLPNGQPLSTVGAVYETALLGDIDLDGTVDQADQSRMDRALQSHRGGPLYDPLADLNDDGLVNEADAGLLDQVRTGAEERIGLLRWTVPASVAESGQQVFILSVTDAEGQQVEQSILYWHNHLPQFVDVPAEQSVTVGARVVLIIRANDADEQDQLSGFEARQASGAPVQSINASFGTALLGDLTGDGKFDPLDWIAFVDAVGSVAGDPDFNPRADLTNDGKIDDQDKSLMLSDARYQTVGLLEWTPAAEHDSQTHQIMFSVTDGHSAPIEVSTSLVVGR